MNKKFTNLEDFQKYAAEHILEFAPDNGESYTCDIKNMQKFNDYMYGLEIGRRDFCVKVIIYLESYFGDYLTGIKPISVILQRIWNSASDELTKIQKNNNFTDFSWLRQLEMVKDFLYPVVLCTDRNKDLLSEIPHIDVERLHLSIILKVDSSKYVPDSSITINSNMLNTWGVNMEQLYDTAINNLTPVLYNRHLKSYNISLRTIDIFLL